MNETKRFESGHECRDNGTGDYNFFCPERVEKLFFLPKFVVELNCVLPKHICPNCKKPIGLPLEEPHA